MDYIFKEWENRLSDFADSVEKDLAEIRKCKANIQQMQLDITAEIQKGRYIRDSQRLVLSAPEIIIGNVDRGGNLLEGGSSVIVRGTQVGIQGAGETGQVELRAASIHEIAEDPGTDGHEHVVGALSEVVSQARNITLQSDDTMGAFSAPAIGTGGSGIRIHADKAIDIHAAMTAESREEQLDQLIQSKETLQKNLKQQASDYKSSFKELSKELDDLLAKKEKLAGDVDDVRSNYADIKELSKQIEACSMALTEQTYTYAEVLSLLAESNRQLKCFKDEKAKIVKGDDFKQQSTGSNVNITGEIIRLLSADGENNLRDNEGSGIMMRANELDIASIEKDGKLKEKGKVSIKAKDIEVATAGMADAAYDDQGELTTATHTAEGDFTLKSKNITIESVDYEVADKKLKEKQLTADSKIKLRAKTIEVSTESSANVEADDKGHTTKADYTPEGDIIMRSKTVNVESTDPEGKSMGSVCINAKSVSVKSMDVDKESHADSALAAGSTMVLVSEKMFVGAKSKDVKSKALQAVSEQIGLFADTTLEAQQGEGKAVVQLADGNAAVGGSKTQVYGETTVNANTEVKGELKAPKVTGDSIEAKSAFKSPNISDGMAAGAAGGGGSLSAKLKAEDAPEER